MGCYIFIYVQWGFTHDALKICEICERIKVFFFTLTNTDCLYVTYIKRPLQLQYFLIPFPLSLWLLTETILIAG